MQNKPPLFVTVQGREGRYFEGNAHSITSYNQKGKFDILPTHTNFITLIEKILQIRKRDGSLQEIPVDNGVLRVANNQVDIYLGIKR
jgi:F0F1-type ATP synthase epsilon subunit